MTGGYQLTRTAEDELGEILLFIANRDGVDRALHVHGKFLDAFDHLSAMSGSGSKRRELTGPHPRWRNVFKWVVIYDPDNSPISILRVIHGARDLERLLRPDR